MLIDRTMMDRLRYWFYGSSLQGILSRAEWRHALEQPHFSLPGHYCWESKQSSLCLLMNHFCCPGVWNSEAAKELFGCRNLTPKFRGSAPLEKRDGSLDPTSIDLVMDDVYVQSSFAKKQFLDQPLSAILRFRCFENVFHASMLPRSREEYFNCRLIRGLLAAFQYGKQHILLCDNRRSDLIENYQATANALVDEEFRSRCRVVFWQDLLTCVDPGLRQFVSKRFLIC